MQTPAVVTMGRESPPTWPDRGKRKHVSIGRISSAERLRRARTMAEIIPAQPVFNRQGWKLGQVVRINNGATEERALCTLFSGRAKLIGKHANLPECRPTVFCKTVESPGLRQ